MVGPWDINGVEWTDDFRVISPEIRRRLWILTGWAVVLQNAKNYLLGSNVVRSPTQLPGFYDFSKRCYFHIRNHGYAGAVPLIQADLNLFKSWGFSASVLQSLALLQGVVVET
jgi:hypothetical protein